MSRTAKVLWIVLALLITQLDYGRSSEKVRFYHGTDYDTALTILNDRNLTPFTVESYMTRAYVPQGALEKIPLSTTGFSPISARGFTLLERRTKTMP
jgi:hypothetical protein